MENEIKKENVLPENLIQTPQQKIQNGLVTRKGEFEKVLPAHISFERFQRTVMTACFANPELFQTDLQSLFLSAIKCATDGLLPDNREAAFVIFNSKVKSPNGDVWVKKAQYIPMWVGILKKIRQSGEILSIRAHVVYEADFQKGKFEYTLGDEEKLEHIPYMGTEPRGAIIAAYCIAKLSNGEIIREVMTFEEIEKIRKTSKSGNDSKTGDAIGIWRDWYEEMARKTVFRRASKWLPQSAELLDRIFENDDSMKDIEEMQPAQLYKKNPLQIEDAKGFEMPKNERDFIDVEERGLEGFNKKNQEQSGIKISDADFQSWTTKLDEAKSIADLNATKSLIDHVYSMYDAPSQEKIDLYYADRLSQIKNRGA